MREYIAERSTIGLSSRHNGLAYQRGFNEDVNFNWKNSPQEIDTRKRIIDRCESIKENR